MAEFRPFNYANTLKNIESIKGARTTNALNTMRLDEGQRKIQMENTMAPIRNRALGGDQDAIMELERMQPGAGSKIREMLGKMNKSDRDAFKDKQEQIGKAGQWVLSLPETQRPAAWDKAITYLMQGGYEGLGELIGKYSDENAQKGVAMSGLMVKAADSFGQPKAGQDEAGDPIFFQTDKSGATRTLQGVTPPAKRSTERQTKIQALIQRGIQPNMAADLVEGRVKVTPPDEFGNVFAVNLSTNKKTLITSGQASQTEQSGQPLALEQPERLQSLDSAIGQGTGPAANIQTFLNNTIGPFMAGQPFEKTAKSRAVIRLFNQEAKTALVNNPRFPVAEMAIVQHLLPDPDRIFVDPDGEREKLKQMRIFLQNKKSRNISAIRSGTITQKHVGKLSNQNASIDRIIGLMGEAESNRYRYNPETGELETLQ